jgi:glycosyltransferase involved in cell wall biosynthesis
MAYFGRFTKDKGVDRSIEFCAVLKSRKVNFVFDLYGDGPVKLYTKKIKQHGVENFITLKNKLPLHKVSEYMATYDFLLQLSNHEGMALSVVEAMNAGLVPLVTPVGEMKRYTKDRENALWLNSPFDNNLNMLAQKS